MLRRSGINSTHRRVIIIIKYIICLTVSWGSMDGYIRYIVQVSKTRRTSLSTRRTMYCYSTIINSTIIKIIDIDLSWRVSIRINNESWSWTFFISCVYSSIMCSSIVTIISIIIVRIIISSILSATGWGGGSIFPILTHCNFFRIVVI